MKETLEYLEAVRKELMMLYITEKDEERKSILKSVTWALDYQTAMMKDKDNIIKRAIKVLNQEDILIN